MVISLNLDTCLAVDDKIKVPIDVVQYQEKFAFCITSFATQHSFATNSVQLRYEGLLLMMVVFYDGHISL